uniref:Uncharacterized protein n=1 Tax=Anguilla anguilla TaxID=7936 RepID=A0A0E9RWT9_ANGAN
MTRSNAKDDSPAHIIPAITTHNVKCFTRGFAHYP